MKKIATQAVKDENVNVKQILKTRLSLVNHECYVPTVERIIEKCFSLKNDYVLRNLYLLVNLCESNILPSKIIQAIDTICPEKVFD